MSVSFYNRAGWLLLDLYALYTISLKGSMMYKVYAKGHGLHLVPHHALFRIVLLLFITLLQSSDYFFRGLSR